MCCLHNSINPTEIKCNHLQTRLQTYICNVLHLNRHYCKLYCKSICKHPIIDVFANTFCKLNHMGFLRCFQMRQFDHLQICIFLISICLHFLLVGTLIPDCEYTPYLHLWHLKSWSSSDSSMKRLLLSFSPAINRFFPNIHTFNWLHRGALSDCSPLSGILHTRRVDSPDHWNTISAFGNRYSYPFDDYLCHISCIKPKSSAIFTLQNPTNTTDLPTRNIPSHSQRL